MEGDILIINKNHKKAARQVVDLIIDDILSTKNLYVISVAGESGAGKSEIAASITEQLNEQDISNYIFQQDDYFVYPPKTNAEQRVKDIKWVGPGEVKIDLIDEHLQKLKEGETLIEKPLVIFEDDKITTEKVDLAGKQVIIVEGTYTTLLNNADCRVFIDRNYKDTRDSRKERNREKQDDFLERILKIEHDIISKHKELANIVITKDYEAKKLI